MGIVFLCCKVFEVVKVGSSTLLAELSLWHAFNFVWVDRVEDIVRVAWLVYVRAYCVPVATLNQNKPSRLLCLGHAQIMSTIFKSGPYSNFWIPPLWIKISKLAILSRKRLALFHAPPEVPLLSKIKHDSMLWQSFLCDMLLTLYESIAWKTLFASLGLFTFARIAFLLQLWTKTSHLDYSVWATPK